MKRANFGRALGGLAAVLVGASTPLMAAPGKADASEKIRAEAAVKAKAEQARAEATAMPEAEKRRADAADKSEQPQKDAKSGSDRKAEARRHRDENKTKRDDSKRDKPKREKAEREKADRDRAGREAEKRRGERDKAANAKKAEATPTPEASKAVPPLTPLPIPVPQKWAITNATMPTSIAVIGHAGAPDAGPAPGQSLLVSFDAPNALGVTEVSSGSVITAAGSIGGVRAAPAGNASVYRSLGAGGESTFDFSGWTKGAPLASLSFEWGSIDSYNFVDFLNRRGETVWTIAGSDFPQFNGDQSSAITNQRLLISFQREADVAAVRMRSKGAAFEFDKLAGAAGTGAVPEPASWLMMIVGFGFVGHGLRRRRNRAIAA